MPIPVVCPACSSKLKAPDKLAGRKAKCPTCGTPIPVPAAVPQPAGRGDAGAPTSSDRASPPDAPATLPSDVASPVAQTLTGAAPSVNRELYEFLAPRQAADEIGRLGPYRVLQVLGHGGMGVVYQAEDPQLKRLVALKAMLPTVAASESARQRFLLEARAAAAIEHDHIVAIYQVGEDRGVPFLAMPFLKGESLQARLERENRLPFADVLRIGRETAEGLAAAHARGLMHRDIKPANIWLEAGRDRVKIVDFGLARAVGGEGGLTQPGMILGTPQYMAPEQAGGQPVDCRCDLFSLGCVLYRLSTGELPFKGNTIYAILAALATEPPRPMAALNPELPQTFIDLVLHLLAKDPVERPPSALVVAETLAELERAQGTTQLGSRPVPRVDAKAAALAHTDPTLVAPPRPPNVPAPATVPSTSAPPTAAPSGKRRGPLVAAVVAVGLLGAAGGAAVWFNPFGARPSAPTTPGPSAGPDAPSGQKSPNLDLQPGPAKSIKGSSTEKSPAPADALTRGKHVPSILRAKVPSTVVAAIDPKLTDEWGGTGAVAWSENGRSLAIGTQQGAIHLWRVPTWEQEGVLRGHPRDITWLAFNHSGRILLSACRSGDGKVLKWKLDAKNRPSSTLSQALPNDGRCLALSRDGSLVATGSWGSKGGGVKLWDLESDKEKPLLKQAEGSSQALAFSSDASWLAAGLDHIGVRLWDLKTGAVRILDGPRFCSSLAFSPDGKQLAGTFNYNEPVRLWDLTAPAKAPRLLRGHKGQVNSVAFSPDGKWLATEGLDGTVRLWDPRTATEVREAIELTAPVTTKMPDRFHRQLAFSPDGRHLAVANGGLYIVRLASLGQ
jgi:serine/threonine protein kinase/sugar lactone lactonase YvrE